MGASVLLVLRVSASTASFTLDEGSIMRIKVH